MSPRFLLFPAPQADRIHKFVLENKNADHFVLPVDVIAIWFIPVALGFDLGRYELAYSLTLTLLGLYFAFRLDEGLAHVEFRPALKALIWLAFVGAVITYVGFSFHVPDNFFIAVG